MCLFSKQTSLGVCPWLMIANLTQVWQLRFPSLPSPHLLVWHRQPPSFADQNSQAVMSISPVHASLQDTLIGIWKHECAVFWEALDDMPSTGCIMSSKAIFPMEWPWAVVSELWTYPLACSILQEMQQFHRLYKLFSYILKSLFCRMMNKLTYDSRSSLTYSMPQQIQKCSMKCSSEPSGWQKLPIKLHFLRLPWGYACHLDPSSQLRT